MAENKKGFLLYCDFIHTLEKMPDDKAGLLFKHILRYVNDLEPTTDDLLVDLTFEPIKQQLKRDLKKFEKAKEEKSNNGRLGNLKRWNLDLYNKVVDEEMTIEEAENIAKNRKTSLSDSQPSQPIANIAVNDNVSVTDTVTVNVTDTVIVKEKDKLRKSLMSEIEISDVPEDEKDYFLIADSFLKLFKRNSEEILKVKWSHLEKAKYKSFVDPIRLMMTIDGRTREEIQKVYKFLQADDFWMRNVQSTDKLRAKFDQLITKTVEPVKTNNHGTEQRIKSGGVTFSQSEADDLQRRARKLLGLDANDDTTNF